MPRLWRCQVLLQPSPKVCIMRRLSRGRLPKAPYATVISRPTTAGASLTWVAEAEEAGLLTHHQACSSAVQHPYIPLPPSSSHLTSMMLSFLVEFRSPLIWLLIIVLERLVPLYYMTKSINITHQQILQSLFGSLMV